VRTFSSISPRDDWFSCCGMENSAGCLKGNTEKK
jgi:hypothetical protein